MLFNLSELVIKRWDGLVGVKTGAAGWKDRGSFIFRVTEFFSSLKYSVRLWSPHSLLFSGYLD